MPLFFTQQPDFITEILFVSQFAAQLRISRYIAFGPQVKTVGRTFFILSQFFAVFPAAGTEIAVGREFHKVTGVFRPDTEAGMVAGNVVVEEGVIAEHAIVKEMALAQPDVCRGAAVNMAQAKLGKRQVFCGIVQWQQHVELAAVQSSAIIHIGLNFDIAVALQPVSHGLVGFTDCHVAQLVFGVIHHIAAFQHARRLGSSACQPTLGAVFCSRGISRRFQTVSQQCIGSRVRHVNLITGPQFRKRFMECPLLVKLF